MTDLATRLRTASEGSRELSDEFLFATEWAVQYGVTGYEWYRPNKTRCPKKDRPDPTRSMDDAMAMVPERKSSNKAAFLQVALYQQCIGDIPDERIPLVICEAILQAKEHGE